MATRERILLELEKGGKTTREMIAAIGGTYASVHTSLRRLTRAGTVVEIVQVDGKKLKETRWVLKSKLVEAAQKVVENTPAPKKKRIKAIIAVDCSGSVNGYRFEINKGLNTTLADLRGEAYRSGITTDISLYYFSSTVRPRFLNVDARDVKSEPVNWPDGATALFDAVEDGINDHLKPERDDEEVQYLLIVITDGANNRSRDNSGTTMKELIRKVQGTDRWTITFQLPPGAKAGFCNTYGIHPGNCVEWELTSDGIERATVARTSGTQQYYAASAAGVRSTKGFYATTDLSKVTSKELKTKLDDIASKVRLFPVPAETEIRPFVERSTGVPYVTGENFYQLTKREKVQPNKKVLVREKGKRAIYAGDEARTLIGIPAGVYVNVTPGNHSNFDVFVESNSVNRKLVRGTQVVHWPTALQ